MDRSGVQWTRRCRFSAGSIDEAVELAKSCPVLKGGSTIQVVETFQAM